jgi:DNA-binding transcriptional regulator YhcF (GntR family)
VARGRTLHVADVRRQLLSRIREAHHRPGQRFFSNRAIASRFNISYQTADRLVRELVEEGVLVRRPASGTYLPGERVKRSGVVLIFHPRAKHKNSFGGYLLDKLTTHLNKERIDWRMSWTLPAIGNRSPIGSSRYPIIWDRPDAVRSIIDIGRTALVLNDRPPAGVGATLIDSVSVDDFSGGAYAAQFLTRRVSGPRTLAILSGPQDDQRSAARVAGFLSVAPAAVVTSPTWFYDGGLKVADEALAAGQHGLFCCNDRLAQAVLRRASERRLPRPLLVGFDDAPIAHWLNLTTIAIPWEEMVAAVIGVVKRRRQSPSSTAIAQLVSTGIVVRD